MESEEYFKIRKPYNPSLLDIVENYFYINIPIAQLTEEEPIIPFPRITFGYFFNHPFKVVNNKLNKVKTINTAISRIGIKNITVEPCTDRIKILGAHMKPFGLASFTKEPINKLPWLIDSQELFGDIAGNFLQTIDTCETVENMFDEMESFLLNSFIVRDLSLIKKAIELIEIKCGNIGVSELSEYLKVSDRTLRNYFYDCIGCSPKEYLRIVKLKQIAYQLKYSKNSLTDIAYDHNYFDQAHFIHELKDATGESPNDLRKKISHFRFLQF